MQLQELKFLTENSIEVLESEGEDKGLLVFKALVAKGDEATKNFNFYPSKEFERAAHELTGRKLFVDHDTSSARNIIGKVRESYFKDGKFYAVCGMDRGDPLASKIMKGLVTDVSLSGGCKEQFCSICGVNITGPWYECEDHTLGKTYEGKIAYRVVSGLTFEEGELSVVAEGAATNVILNYKKEKVDITMSEGMKELQDMIKAQNEKIELMNVKFEAKEKAADMLEAELQILKKKESDENEKQRVARYEELKTICEKLGQKHEQWKDRRIETLEEFITLFKPLVKVEDVTVEKGGKSRTDTSPIGGVDTPKKNTFSDDDAITLVAAKMYKMDRSKLTEEAKAHAAWVVKTY